jgi:hypothetical protein
MSQSQKVQAYYNWSLHALIGLDNAAADKYLNENLATIKEIAGALLRDMEIEPQEIYRGILMHEADLTELKPHDNYTYLSFSDDPKIANSFADVNGFGSEFGINHNLGRYGYVVSYTPQLSEILFHHSFLDVFPYRKHMKQIVGDTSKTMDIQKEVMILQPAEPFKNLRLQI